ncbi:MAG: cytochrome c biogenesis protein [Terriglobia bacterium]
MKSLRWEKGLGVVLALVLVATMYGAFLVAPEEATMGEIQRIFYVHMPAWIAAFAGYLVVFLASVAFLVTKNLKWDRIALACAEVGTLFCTTGLVTGPIWAKPVWGIWWTWDARLTTALILWLMFVSYLLLRDFLEEPVRRATLSAVFGIFAFADVPLVYMSIRLWRTQHPQPVLGGGEESGLDPTMFQVLVLAWIAFLFLLLLLAILRVRLEKARDEVGQLRRELMMS